jgi:hypothetical protein
MQSFIAVNNSFSMMQAGLDMAPPPPPQIDTWESDCRNYNTTLRPSKKVQSEDLAGFNAMLTEDNVKAFEMAATKLTPASCTLGPGVERLPRGGEPRHRYPLSGLLGRRTGHHRSGASTLPPVACHECRRVAAGNRGVKGIGTARTDAAASCAVSRATAGVSGI